MIVRAGFLVATSIASYAVKQINVKSPKREDDLKKPSDLENDDALINEEEEKLHVTCSNNGLNEVVVSVDVFFHAQRCCYCIFDIICNV
ncbi:hypothetical protein ACS0TY_011406 [Phlomoides rotata]